VTSVLPTESDLHYSYDVVTITFVYRRFTCSTWG
jgi:hypothetical protein